MSRPDWLDAAEALPLGKSRRWVHGCSLNKDTPNMMVSHNDAGYSAYCFRCGPQPFFPGPRPTVEEMVARRKRQAEADRAAQDQTIDEIVLPGPRVKDMTDWPAAACLWWFKAGMTQKDATDMGVYYHADTDRVVIPVWDRSTMTASYYQARACDGRNPKYINPRVDRTAIVYEAGIDWGEGRVVLTEDILSARRVWLADQPSMGGGLWTAWSLMGTKLHDKILSRLIHREGLEEVVVWLDPDEAGQKAQREICKRLDIFGVPYRSVVSEKDPKYLSHDFIKGILTS